MVITTRSQGTQNKFMWQPSRKGQVNKLAANGLSFASQVWREFFKSSPMQQNKWKPGSLFPSDWIPPDAKMNPHVNGKGWRFLTKPRILNGELLCATCSYNSWNWKIVRLHVINVGELWTLWWYHIAQLDKEKAEHTGQRNQFFTSAWSLMKNTEKLVNYWKNA